MNAGQIIHILRKHHKTRDSFLTCCPSDSIPTSQLYPYSVVINTDDSTQSGTHWVCVYAPNQNTIEYFDSYAMDPNPNISQYLEKFAKIVKNTTSLQGILSGVCGQYCIYFVIKRS